METKGSLQPVIIIILGVSGDLSRRYLLPALNQIVKAGKLSKSYKIIGVSRRAIDKNLVLGDCNDLQDNYDQFQMDSTKLSDYKNLQRKLSKISDELGGNAQVIFYLAVPPISSPSIIDKLGEAGLNGPNTKLLLEKPFGVDLESARIVIAETNKYFEESQIYRIDHYLAKEMAQNITVFLSSNALFRGVWNNQLIDHIDIIATEKINIEDRAVFYEQTGALRDVMQSHLMQLAALTLMEACPDPFDFSDVPMRRLAALKELLPVNSGSIARAQYKGYRDEVNSPESEVETFVSVILESRSARWEGVPIRLVTGKNLDEKLTAICVHFKKSHKAEANLLMLRVQPNEGIEIDVWVKKPGYNHEIQKQKMQFSYGQGHGRLAGAYEQVLVEAIAGKHDLFASSEEVVESWRVLQPALEQWQKADGDIPLYEGGSKISDILGGDYEDN